MVAEKEAEAEAEAEAEEEARRASVPRACAIAELTASAVLCVPVWRVSR